MYPSILSFETINKLKLSFECGIPRPSLSTVFDLKADPGHRVWLITRVNTDSPTSSLHRLLATAIFLSNYTVQLQCLQRAPGRRVTEKCHFSTLNVGLAGTGNRTQATCFAGSVSRRSAIHYTRSYGLLAEIKKSSHCPVLSFSKFMLCDIGSWRATTQWHRHI
jgi:hypothetical protein